MTTGNASPVLEPLKDYASLLQSIKNLPEPEPGKVRVFRGQNGNYPQMLATGSRPQKLINSSLFGMATRVLVQSLLSEIDINLELDMMLFWTQAVAQHYGPGSSYLDVTYSLDVALWFALHEYKPVGVTLVFGEGDQPDPANDIYRKEHWVTYPDWTKTAYLYVFDAPKWKPGLGSTHGQLIDLADAPPIFSSSARMRAQSGCLLDAGVDRAKADLSDCFKVAPIPIAWPMTGAPKLNWTSEDLFPGPEIDEWYKRFLAIPLVPQPDRSTPPQITMAHPVPVTVYMPREKERALAVMNCEVGISPALMYSTLGNPTLEPYDPVSQKSEKLALSDATVIVVESPLRFITPPIDYDGWNQALLWGDISESVPVFESLPNPAGSASLQNVFVEFSPLDAPSAEGAAASGQDAQILRGAWVARNGSGLSASLFFQSFPGGQTMQAALGKIVLDASTNTIRYEFHGDHSSAGATVEWRELTAIPIFAKPVFTVLFILRELSPTLKALPFPSVVTDAGTESQKMWVDVSKDAARLLRVRDSRNSRPVHFLRGVELDESFVSPRPVGGLALSLNMPYAKIDAAAIRSAIAAKFEASDATHPEQIKEA